MRYHDDIDAEPRRLRLKEGAPRSTFEQRLSTLERKVAELSNILNGVTQQLVEVSSVVNALERRGNVYEHADERADDITVEPVVVPAEERPRKKTAYLVADSEAPPKPRQRVNNDIIIADRDS